MIRFGILLSVAAVVLSASAQAGSSEAMAFAIGQCSAETDAAARLACYDGLAAQLKTGIPLPSAPAGSAVTPRVAPAPVAEAQPVAPHAPVAEAQPAAPQVAPPPAQVAAVPPAAPHTQSGSWYDPTSWFGKTAPELASKNPADFGAEAIPQSSSAGASDESEPLQQIQSNIATVSFAPNGRFIVTLANGQVWRQLDGDVGKARFEKNGHYAATISRGALGSYNLAVNDGDTIYKVRRLK